jgi:hypothetical protein
MTRTGLQFGQRCCRRNNSILGADDILQQQVLTDSSSISLIFLSLPAAMMVFMSGVTATPLHVHNTAHRVAVKAALMLVSSTFECCTPGEIDA